MDKSRCARLRTRTGQLAPTRGTSDDLLSRAEIDIDMDRYSAGSGLPRIVLRVAVVAIGFFAGGCYPKVAPPPGALSADSVASASRRWPGVTDSSLSHGRDLFVAHCNVCHGYPDVAAISDDRWPGIIEKMAKKAHLNTEDGDAVLHFVLASRSEQGAR
jgi:hypothetical protein